MTNYNFLLVLNLRKTLLYNKCIINKSTTDIDEKLFQTVGILPIRFSIVNSYFSLHNNIPIVKKTLPKLYYYYTSILSRYVFIKIRKIPSRR